jgi:hypothetical protein
MFYTWGISRHYSLRETISLLRDLVHMGLTTKTYIPINTVTYNNTLYIHSGLSDLNILHNGLESSSYTIRSTNNNSE